MHYNRHYLVDKSFSKGLLQHQRKYSMGSDDLEKVDVLVKNSICVALYSHFMHKVPVWLIQAAACVQAVERSHVNPYKAKGAHHLSAPGSRCAGMTGCVSRTIAYILVPLAHCPKMDAHVNSSNLLCQIHSTSSQQDQSNRPYFSGGSPSSTHQTCQNGWQITYSTFRQKWTSDTSPGIRYDGPEQ